MAGRKVAATVTVTSPAGQQVTLMPGDEAPQWAEDLIRNPKVWGAEPVGVVEARGGDVSEVVSSETVPAKVDATPDYEAMTVADLRGLIADRNEGRQDEDRISTEGRKGDLIDALIADDRS